jgi:hypothetical protein
MLHAYTLRVREIDSGKERTFTSVPDGQWCEMVEKYRMGL